MISSSIHRGIKNGDIESAGFFAFKLGTPTAMGALVVHIIFSLGVAGLYVSF
ncbi:MAG: hypothetical protein OTJ43_00140 [Dehalococcoidia bacterium]|nr:hypothetical protein [Dehalococcoidia bacterium]